MTTDLLTLLQRASSANYRKSDDEVGEWLDAAIAIVEGGTVKWEAPGEDDCEQTGEPPFPPPPGVQSYLVIPLRDPEPEMTDRHRKLAVAAIVGYRGGEGDHDGSNPPNFCDNNPDLVARTALAIAKAEQEIDDA